jgi:predicted phosphodiesterase
VKRAIISDIHGNLDALGAVMSDIRQQGADEVYCLGDIVGYGPNPCECIQVAVQLDTCILGNHDLGALFDPEGFSSNAEQAIFWTRRQLEAPLNPEDPDDPVSRARQVAQWNFLCELPRTVREDPYLFVHGSARNPLHEYVFPEDVFNKQKLDRIFSFIPQYCFQGHTHVPGIFTAAGTFLRPDELESGYRLGAQKIMVNVGSVGQPRDGDPRACYVLLDEDTIRFRRIEYPVEKVVAKIHAIDDLDNFLGDRLLEGR